MNWRERLFGKKHIPLSPEPGWTPPSGGVQRPAGQAAAIPDHSLAELLTLSSEVRDALGELRRDDSRAVVAGQLTVVAARLDDLAEVAGSPQWLTPLDQRMAAVADWLERSDDQLAEASEQIKKLNRSYFKANTLAEAQAQRADASLETLGRSLALHEEQAAQWQQAARSQAEESRLRVVEAILPVLDGLEQALASGRGYLERQAEAQAGLAPPSLGDRIAYALGRKLPPAVLDSGPLAAWLDGLALLRERMLAVLANEGVRPLLALGQPFDPYRHVAVALADPACYPNAEPGSVVEEQRRGYAAGQRILRFAEVVVLPVRQSQANSVGDQPERLEQAGVTGGRPERLVQAVTVGDWPERLVQAGVAGDRPERYIAETPDE